MSLSSSLTPSALQEKISVLEARILALEASIPALEGSSDEYHALLMAASSEEKSMWAELLMETMKEITATTEWITEIRKTLIILLKQQQSTNAGKQPVPFLPLFSPSRRSKL